MRQTLAFDDVLLRPHLGVLEHRGDADISTWFGGYGYDVPFISAPMPDVTDGLFAREMCSLGGTGIIHRFMKPEDQVREWELSGGGGIYCAVGLDLDHVELLREAGCWHYCLDVAHAHSRAVLEFLDQNIKWDEVWIVGNVATAEGVRALENIGASAIKVGIGPGSACTTRTVSGHGVPQLSAIMECARAAEVPILADGGIRNAGDIVKSLAAGAEAVVIGGLFARAIEAPNNGSYRGCASFEMNGHHAPEGVTVTYTVARETLKDIVDSLAWGVCSGISYAGARDLADLREFAEWQLLTPAGQQESFS